MNAESTESDEKVLESEITFVIQKRPRGRPKGDTDRKEYLKKRYQEKKVEIIKYQTEKYKENKEEIIIRNKEYSDRYRESYKLLKLILLDNSNQIQTKYRERIKSIFV